ncbi:MAG: spore coat protein CotJB [Oscillospiraceae bacterium]|nr:spore coat protein CotJB [Oscillospiraceae bacterium]MBR3952974.1 spore coat protein CotJB [Oscillospiraceae bacterium]
MNEQKTLLSRIATCDFILTETALFLDTHPECEEALAFYEKHLGMKKKAEEEYTSKYGMLKHCDYKGQNTWQWTEGPWPWEYEEV